MEIASALILVVLAGIILRFAWSHPLAPGLAASTLGNGLLRLSFFAVFLGAFYFFSARPSQRHWSFPLLLLVCWLDLLTALPWQNPTVDASVFQPDFAKIYDKLNPEPSLGESRLMISSFSAHQISTSRPGT